MENLEFIKRLLEIYTFEEILELCDLPEEEALDYLEQSGAISFDDIPV